MRPVPPNTLGGGLAFANRWTSTLRFIGPRGSRKSFPSTEVDDDIYAGMYEIARLRGCSIYDVCRMAFRTIVDNYDFNEG